MFRYITIFILLSIQPIFGLSAIGQLLEKGPRMVVEDLQLTLLDIMQNADELGYTGRYERIDSTIRSSHALTRIAKVTVGRYWKQLDKEQKTALIEKFSDFSVSNYASMFSGYSGEQFKILGEDELKRGRKLVRTVLIKSDGEEIRLDYVLTPSNDGWKIINITTNGISDLALKRAEYTSVIAKEGFDGFLSKLEQKIKDFAEPSETPNVGQND